MELFKDSLGIEEEIVIERAHRTGIKKDGRPRTIVMKLLNFKQKELVLRHAHKLKGTNTFINEDFCLETRIIRKNLKEEMFQKRKEGKYCIILYDKLIVRPFRKPHMKLRSRDF